MAQQTSLVWSSHSRLDRACLQGSMHACHRLVRCCRGSVDWASESQDEHLQGVQGHRRAHPPHSVQWAAAGVCSPESWPGCKASGEGSTPFPPSMKEAEKTLSAGAGLPAFVWLWENSQIKPKGRLCTQQKEGSINLYTPGCCIFTLKSSSPEFRKSSVYRGFRSGRCKARWLHTESYTARQAGEEQIF